MMEREVGEMRVCVCVCKCACVHVYTKTHTHTNTNTHTHTRTRTHFCQKSQNHECLDYKGTGTDKEGQAMLVYEALSY